MEAHRRELVSYRGDLRVHLLEVGRVAQPRCEPLAGGGPRIGLDVVGLAFRRRRVLAGEPVLDASRFAGCPLLRLLRLSPSTHCLPFWALSFAQSIAGPKSFLNALTAPMTTKSTACSIGLRTFSMTVLDLLGDAAEAEQAGEEGDRQRERLGEAVLDLLGDDPDVALGDRADRVEDRVDELHDLAAALDEEHDDVVDRLARLDEGGGRVQEGDQPGDAGLDDLLDDEVLDLAEDDVLEVADLVLDPLPEAGEALGDERLEDVDGLLELGHDRLADELRPRGRGCCGR